MNEASGSPSLRRDRRPPMSHLHMQEVSFNLKVSIFFFSFIRQLSLGPGGTDAGAGRAEHPLGNVALLKKKKSVFRSENRSPTGLVSFNMQNSLSLSSERWRTVHLLCLLCRVGVWGCVEAIHQISMLTLARLSIFFYFFFPLPEICLSTLSSLSILIQRNGAGVVKYPQPQNQI